MKTTMLRSLSLFIVSVLMAFSVAAQDEAKVKIKEKKDKYKSEDLKIKDNRDESKYKADGMKIKEGDGTTKMKAHVVPMNATYKSKTELKTGETNVMTKEHPTPIKAMVPEPEPTVVNEVQVPETPAPVTKTTTHRYVAKKTAHKPVTRSTGPKPRYIVKTKVIRDTVYTPSAPERVVTVDTQYLHDTVSMTRVDTVIKREKENTYTGYAVPRGNFKKVKLKKDKQTDEVRMKTKE